MISLFPVPSYQAHERRNYKTRLSRKMNSDVHGTHSTSRWCRRWLGRVSENFLRLQGTVQSFSWRLRAHANETAATTTTKLVSDVERNHWFADSGERGTRVDVARIRFHLKLSRVRGTAFVHRCFKRPRYRKKGASIDGFVMPNRFHGRCKEWQCLDGFWPIIIPVTRSMK